MVEILEVFPSLGEIPLLVELTGRCPTFSGGNWGKVVLVINFSLLNLLEHFFFDFVFYQHFGLNGAGFRAIGIGLSSV